MQNCKKCAAALPDGALFCPMCGKEQNPAKKRSKRGNGQGTVVKQPNGTYKATVTLSYFMDESGKRRRKTRSKIFKKRSDAIAALPELMKDPKKPGDEITFEKLFDKWEETHTAGKSTMDCYHAAFKHFRPLWGARIRDIDVDDLQECIDACGKGKRTQENMRSLVGLMYKYGIPRRHIPDNLNLAQFLKVSGEKSAHRESFTDVQIERIRQQIGKTPGADAVYCMIYLGFRPSEFLSLRKSNYDRKERCFIGGAKTAAGKDRIVTVSPKIQRHVDRLSVGADSDPFFPAPNGGAWQLKAFTESVFYPVLEAAGIDNPMIEIAGGKLRHKFTPHSCRHTFSTLMKRIEAPEKDKLELIGHTSGEMLRYYQDVNLADLQRITNAL